MESLKASAVAWLKEEIITAYERKSDIVFSSTAALGAAQPYLFPDTSALADASEEELVEELTMSFPFHMAVANFLYFVASETYKHVVPPGMLSVAEQIYLSPLGAAVKRVGDLLGGRSTSSGLKFSGEDVERMTVEFQLLGTRIDMAAGQINEV